tara:strand:- start:12777 stop:13184 length:408 start_codon:yes stop_codon:yes gene_type:complete
MSKEIKVVRLEPMSKFDNTDCVCQVVIGVTMSEGEHSAYVDGVYSYPMDSMPTVAEFNAGANALVSQFYADQGWDKQLSDQLEAAKKRDVPVADFEAPEVTVDTSVEPAVGSPANPAPVEEESSEEEESEEESGE